MPVDPLNAEPALGVKTAFSVCAPTASVASVVAAVPPVTVTGEPMLVAPSSNCTVPEAVGLTVAVKVEVRAHLLRAGRAHTESGGRRGQRRGADRPRPRSHSRQFR